MFEVPLSKHPNSVRFAAPTSKAIQQSGVDREQLWVTSKVRVQSCNSPEDVVKAGERGWVRGSQRFFVLPCLSLIIVTYCNYNFDSCMLIFWFAWIAFFVLRGDMLCPEVNLDNFEDRKLWNNSRHWNLRQLATVCNIFFPNRSESLLEVDSCCYPSL